MKLVVRHGERLEEVTVERRRGGVDVTVGDTVHRVDERRLDDHHVSLLVDGVQDELVVLPDGADGFVVSTRRDGSGRLEVVDPLTHLARESGGAAAARSTEQVTAYMPGRVVEVLVEEGTEVEAGDGVVVLEAMKMENEIVAEHAGVVKTIYVEADQPVDGGDPLFELE